MNEQSQTKTISKQSLAIINCQVDVPYAQGTKFLDRLIATNLSLPEGSPLNGKELRFSVFKEDLKTYIRGKDKIVADIQEKERADNPDYGPDRSIVQVYDDQGNPVSLVKKGGGGGGYRRSLEDDIALEKFKRRSIEGQAAVAVVGQVLTSPNPMTPEELGIEEEDLKRIIGKYWKTVEKMFDNYLDDKVPTTNQRPPSRQGKAKPADKVQSDSGQQNGELKNIGQLLTKALKLDPPVNASELLKELGVEDPKDVKDLEAAWNKAQAISKWKADKAATT